MVVIRAFNAMKAHYKRKMFLSACCIGNHFTCSSSASAVNQSGIKDHIIVGDNCEICGTLITDSTGKIKIGEHTTIRYDSLIGANQNISIGKYVIISNNVIIRDNNSHPTDAVSRQKMCQSGFESELWSWKYAESKPIVIEDNVWIGERAIILKGVTIGKGSVVATGAIVTKDVRPDTIVAGNPAREVKRLKESNES